MTRNRETITIELNENLKQKAEIKRALSDENISDVVREALQEWVQGINIEVHDVGDAQTSFTVTDDKALIDHKR